MAFEVTEKNVSALEPLFKPWEEPTRHRLPNPRRGEPAIIEPGRRPSKVVLVRAIRAEVDRWRRGGYGGVSETSRALLLHWFENEHRVKDDRGDLVPFRYHWAQREAVETFIYLYELRGVRSVAQLLSEFGDDKIAELALSIAPEEDRWARYCSKIATGAGKTKIMSLAVVWSYFHSLYEWNSDLPRHFVVIAPNLTVYERLKEDFENCAIFYQDPLLPEEWRGDFQMQVVLQDEPGGATTAGAIYLTNIQRLYESRREKNEVAGDPAVAIFGPPVVRGRALEAGENLRQRIAAHPRLMVINDEAHHLHDPDLMWNRAIETLHEESLERGNQGVGLQLDFTATPKHNDGSLFRHIVVDFPLGEAVDAGIVKVPVLGESDELVVRGDKKTPAAQRYAVHLQLGYQRYRRTFEELGRVRKPILLVMTEDGAAANEIAEHLDSGEFPLLKGRVLNIHTRLKGRIKEVTRGGKTFKEFVENETAMKPEDLRALREMSRELDSADSKFRCVVSVMMLREGWDVRNVTTIVPLRPYSAKSGILPEQTLGRGLRRMFPLSETPEMVTVIEHPAFRKLYEDELEQEGLEIGVTRVSRDFKQTVTIFVDHRRKVVDELEIEIPLVSDAVETIAELEGLALEDIREYFQNNFQALPVGDRRNASIEFRERHLFTDEIVTQLTLDAGLLNNAWSAPVYFAQMLGRACRIANAHQALTPLIGRFIAEVLFERPVDLYSGEVDHRMRDLDVTETIYAVFTPLILGKTVRRQERRRISRGQCLSAWKPYQTASTEQRPAVPARRTMFNLVPCDSEFEQEFVNFLDRAGDVVAFAKNAGPQKLMIDYVRPDRRLALYVPDFFVRTDTGGCCLVELKGRQDALVPVKAGAAVEWCKAATAGRQTAWRYVYVPYDLFLRSAASTMAELARACEPALHALLEELKSSQMTLDLEAAAVQSETEAVVRKALDAAGVGELPKELEGPVRQAVRLLDYAVRSRQPDFAHAFQPLLRPLDDWAFRILEKELKGAIPADPGKVHFFFHPNLDRVSARDKVLLERNQQHLRDNLVHGRSIQRVGVLLFCLEYAQRGAESVGGIWTAVAKQFAAPAYKALFRQLDPVNYFRNTRVAHVEQPLTDGKEAWNAMHQWLACLSQMAALAAR